SARSGADNHRKVMLTTTPVPPTRTRAEKRWYLACHAAVSAQTQPISHISANHGLKLESDTALNTGKGRTSNKGAPIMIAIIRYSCGCRRLVPFHLTSHAALADSRNMVVS